MEKAYLSGLVLPCEVFETLLLTFLGVDLWVGEEWVWVSVSLLLEDQGC